MAGIMLVAHGQVAQPKLTYPKAHKGDVVDTYFGIGVPDPYRWLENDTSEATAAWVAAENKVTDEYLSKIPFRSALLKRLTDLSDYERMSLPSKKNGKYYFYKNDGLQNQDVLYVQDSLDGEPRVLLDPNKLSADGTVALTGTSLSHDGRYMAYTISRSGSDWAEIFVIDAKTGRQLDDHIVWAKFTGASWHGDGFYYSAYDAPEKGKEYSNVNERHKVYYHKIGTPQAADKLVYENKDYPKRFYTAGVSEDETTMFVYESGEGNGNGLYMKDLTKPDAQLTPMATDMRYMHVPIETIGGRTYIYTNYGAPKYRIMAATADKPAAADWQEIVPEGEAVLSGASVIGGRLILTYNKDVADHAYVYTLDGRVMHEVKLPSLGSVGFSGDKDDKECFFAFTSFTSPGTSYKYDIEANTYTLLRKSKADFDPDGYVTEQIFYPGKDGTKIPMFLTYKKGLRKDGRNPVLIYGYGGFNISLPPTFSTSRIPFIENGGIYVQANLRGGGEYGEEWHLAGTKMRKQNVFDDFISAAEWLIANRYTDKDKIAIMGGSNGGLLVGACMTQRPDLYRVAVPQVGVMDMLRYHKFTIGWNWAGDYGTSEDSKEMFEYLKGYSPLHNLKPGTSYPATLVTTADHDDRVVPAHSFKFAATLQECNAGPNPTLIRIDSKAGHGAGKPMSKVLEEQADIYGFIMYNLGMDYNVK